MNTDTLEKMKQMRLLGMHLLLEPAWSRQKTNSLLLMR